MTTNVWVEQVSQLIHLFKPQNCVRISIEVSSGCEA